jgi:flagellar motility protein MotE (MotC chaperone)
MKIKVLHAFIIAASLFLVVRVIDISSQPEDGFLRFMARSLSFSPIAQETSAEEKAAVEKKKAEDKKSRDEKPAEEMTEGTASSKKATAAEAAKISNEAPMQANTEVTFSPVEVDILQRLSERRERLDKWEIDLQVKENVLKITEQRLDKKLDELRQLKREVEASLAEYNKKEDDKIKSLIKIYENMKPKPAADILAKMDMQSLLPIMSRMKEKAAADILSKMDSERAETITTRLSELGRLRRVPQQ